MFHFKHFSVSHSQSTMKVGTDAVLLGAWMPVPDNCRNVLDIGCGCGVISLMLAQRCNANITGIDIDEKSVEEAQQNAKNSPWQSRVQFIHDDLRHFAEKKSKKFDVIVSNPPFFEDSLKSPVQHKNIAKHNVSMTLKTLCDSVDNLLAENGRFGIILPNGAAQKFAMLAENNQMYVTKKTEVYPTLSKKSKRILMMYEREIRTCEEEQLVIRNQGYTDEYLQFVKEYLLMNK